MNTHHRRRRALIALVLCILTAYSGFTGPSAVFARGDDPGESKDGKTKKASESDSGKKSKGKKRSKPGKSSSDDKGRGVPANKKEEKKVMEALPAAMRENFKLKRTLHYSILYDTSEEDVAVFEHAIERTYRSCVRFCEKLGVKVHEPEEKMISYFFNEFKDYSSFGGAAQGGTELSPNVLGFYLPSTNYTYFYNFRNTPFFKQARDSAIARLEQLGEQARQAKDPSAKKGLQEQMNQARWIINRSKSFGGGVTEETLQHEVSHQVLFNVGFHNRKEFTTNPRWFAEGMAQLFEPVSTEKGGNMGIVNKDKARAFNELARVNALYPLKTFIQDIRPFVSGDIGGISYPQAWGLAHYLTRTKREELKLYVSEILKRPKSYKTNADAEIDLFEKCFGKIDKKWERKWKAWMKNVR